MISCRCLTVITLLNLMDDQSERRALGSGMRVFFSEISCLQRLIQIYSDAMLLNI